MILTAAILAGGQSRRMGTDKAQLEVGGFSLLERTARVSLEAGLPAMIVGRVCPEGWPLPAVEFVADTLPGQGPLGGLQTALMQAGVPALALACDLPLLTADALRWLAEEAAQGDWEDGLAVISKGVPEPLFSVYAPSCLPLIESRLTVGRLSLGGLIAAGNFRQVAAPDWVAAQLVNVNTPEEFARLGERL